MSRLGSQTLPMTKQALAGFRRLCPPTTRLPLPSPVISAIANAVMRMGAPRLAVITKLGERLYLRPGELLSLKRKQISPPAPLLGLLYWSVVMHPEEDAVPSKTFNFNDCLMLDNPHFAFLDPFMERFHAHSEQEGRITLFKVYEFSRLFQTAAELAGVSCSRCPATCGTPAPPPT